MKIVIAIITLLILYVIALVSARDIREDDAVFGVNKGQWEALIIMWLYILVALALQGRGV